MICAEYSTPSVSVIVNLPSVWLYEISSIPLPPNCNSTQHPFGSLEIPSVLAFATCATKPLPGNAGSIVNSPSGDVLTAF